MKIGIDIVEIERFAGFKYPDIFSAAELEYIQDKNNPPETTAGLYAAKEAYFKATGTGIIKSKLPEIEIAHDQNGKPYYRNNPTASLSISHTKTTAVAVCIIM
jgi:phosphopantetheine--protein transferase-like protein